MFLILLAVVLFAALAYAVTSSMRGGGQSASVENVELGVAQITQWFTTVDNAIMRMNMSGIPYEDISFSYEAKFMGNPSNPNYLHNTRCTTNKCKIFHPEGGGVAPPSFAKWATPNPTGSLANWFVPGEAFVLHMMQWPGAGTSLNDVAMLLYFLSPDICTAINKKAGIDTIPSRTGAGVNGFTPSLWDDENAYVVSANERPLYGTDTFALAFTGTGNGRYCHIYHVAIKR